MCIIASYFCHLIKLFCLFPRFWYELCVVIWNSLLQTWNHANLSKNQVKKCCILKLDRYIYRNLKIEAWQLYLSRITKISFSELFFTYIQAMCLSFLLFTTLDIYNDYFKGHYKIVALVVASILWPKTIFPSSSFSWKSCCVCTP